MRLSHPCELGAFRDLHCVSPEQLQVPAEDVVERACIHAAASINDLVYLTLIPGFPEVRHEVVIVGVADQVGEHPAAETLVFAGLCHVAREDQLVHR